jgi:poly-gamma-glutamate capsule biosynthesis protein CapA/YwtB (metallophosphatase superfamily)
MTDRKTLDRARLLFVGDTQGDKLAREVIAIAERNAKKAALWEEVADQKDKELATLRSQCDELWDKLTPLKDAVLFARALAYAVADKVRLLP